MCWPTKLLFLCLFKTPHSANFSTVAHKPIFLRLSSLGEYKWVIFYKVRFWPLELYKNFLYKFDFTSRVCYDFYGLLRVTCIIFERITILEVSKLNKTQDSIWPLLPIVSFMLTILPSMIDRMQLSPICTSYCVEFLWVSTV